MKKLIVMGAALTSLLAIFLACEENATDPELAGGTVTFNLSAPAFDDVSGNAAAVSLWATWGGSNPVLIVDAIFSGSSTTLQIPDVTGGTYIAVAAIDANSDGLPSDGPADTGDLFWGALDVIVDGNTTISVSSYAWQRVEENRVIVGVKGIPAGHNGQVFAAGIFADGFDILTGAEIEPLYGGVGLIYNNSAVLALTPDNDTSAVAIPAGNYDIFMLVDSDGDIQTWNDSTGNENPFSNGDYIAAYDFAYDPVTNNDPLITGEFSLIATYDLTLNITAPVDHNVEGNTVVGFVFTNLESDGPLFMQEGVITGGAASITMTVMSSWNIMAGAFIDVNGDYTYDQGPSGGDLLWGAMNLSLGADLAIDIPQDGWQEFNYQVVGLEGIPAGHDGQVIAIGMKENGAIPFNPYNEYTLMGGAGLIYNNSAIVCLGPAGYADSSWVLPYADYDLWCLVDVDGAIGDYDNVSDSLIFSPATDGDFYFKYDYTYTEMQAVDDFVHVVGTFTPVVGISGTITCPGWNSGGGDTYVYLFKENPLVADSARAYAARILTQPGTYWLPCLPGDSVYAVGFWDTDNSGEWDGPSQDDLIGGYGPSIDSLETVQGSELGVGGIDFTLDTPYDSTLYGR